MRRSLVRGRLSPFSAQPGLRSGRLAEALSRWLALPGFVLPAAAAPPPQLQPPAAAASTDRTVAAAAAAQWSAFWAAGALRSLPQCARSLSRPARFQLRVKSRRLRLAFSHDSNALLYSRDNNQAASSCPALRNWRCWSHRVAWTPWAAAAAWHGALFLLEPRPASARTHSRFSNGRARSALQVIHACVFPPWPLIASSRLPPELRGRIELAEAAFRRSLGDAALLGQLEAVEGLAPLVEELDAGGATVCACVRQQGTFFLDPSASEHPSLSSP